MFLGNSPSTITSRDMILQIFQQQVSHLHLSIYLYIYNIYYVHIHIYHYLNPWFSSGPINCGPRKLLASRYRKEKTGSMSEDDLRRVQREICRVKDLEKRRFARARWRAFASSDWNTWIEDLVKYLEYLWYLWTLNYDKQNMKVNYYYYILLDLWV